MRVKRVGLYLFSPMMFGLIWCTVNAAGITSPDDVDFTWPSVGPGSEKVRIPPRPVLRPTAPIRQSVTPGRVGSPVMAYGFNGVNGTSKDGELFKPPDTHIAVGPGVGAAGRVIMVTNSDIEIWDKTGVLLASSEGLSNFQNLPVGTCFDPKILYDEHVRRFFIIMLEGEDPNKSIIHLAVSTTATPSNLLGDWVKMQGDGRASFNGTICWSDYPSIGSDGSSLFVTTNLFDPSTNFRGAKIRVFDKSTTHGILSGIYAFADIDIDDLNAFTIQPAHAYGTTDNGHFYLINRVGSTSYRLWEVAGAPSEPVIVTSASQVWSSGVQVATGAPQKNTGVILDTLSGRIINAVYRNANLWCVLSSDTNSDGKTEVFWARILTDGGFPNAPVVADSGSIGGSSGVEWTFMPSINVNAANDVAICYTQSNSTQFPEMRYVTRYHDDLAGTFQPSRVAAASPGFYDDFQTPTIERWGDFSATVVDPDDKTLFWAANELALAPASQVDNTRWNTFIAHLGPVIPAGVTSTPPLAFIIGSVSVIRSQGIVTSPVATIVDAQTPVSALIIGASGASAGLDVTVQKNTNVVSASAEASATVPIGPHPINLTVTDGDALSTTVTFNVFVLAGTNSPPTLGDYPPLKVLNSNTVIPYAPPADVDLNIVSVRVSPTVLPGGGTVTINPNTGSVTVMTAPGTVLGIYTATVTVSDSLGATAVKQFQITVLPTAVQDWTLFR